MRSADEQSHSLLGHTLQPWEPGELKCRRPARRSNGIKLLRCQPYCTLVPIALAVASVASGASPDFAYFEKHIRPVFVAHCYECHSAEAAKLKGGLRLDFRGGWEQGGDSGPAIIPGNPDESRLLDAIRYHNPDLEMPPDGPLPAEVVATFEEWIRLGAPDPRTDPGGATAATDSAPIDLEAGRQFWSFQPLSDPAPPAVSDESWPRDDLDRFILANLESRGLSPAGDASPHALLRRLHLDLIGLPPTVAQIDRFVAHYELDSRAAIEAKVDRLLSSPAFGERWGRHWLDLARYADSSGGGRAIPLPDAWRFRDYVIAAFNDDRPLDQLIREHLAGDLLPFENREERLRNLVATGFLVLGPHNYENQDKELLDLEIVDEQLDTIGRAFLGMTIGCARCHDHKFDPIPASDYYALAGIFTSTVSVKHANVSSWHKEPVPLTPEQERARKEAAEEIAALEARIKELRELLGQSDSAGASNKPVAAADLPGLVLDTDEAEIVGEWTSSTHSPRWVGSGYLHDRSERKGAKSVTWRPEILETGRYEVRVSYSAGSNRPTNTPLTIHHAGGETTAKIDQRRKPSHDGLFHSLGSFEFTAGQEGYVRISTEGTQGAVIADAVQLLRADDQPSAPAAKPDTPKRPEAETAALEMELAAAEKNLKAAQDRAPKPSTVMAVRDAADPADTKIRVRGMPRNLGPDVPRGFLQVALPADAPPLALASGSGRRELAEWIASPHNPLTARVLANRLWLHLFGSGLVTTPDNFGLTGEPPTHPELLDHLARRLIDNGWSTKELVRALVLSRTYRLSAAPLAAARKLDPPNALLSHAHRRPLDAESLRDSILLLAGELDRTAGGPGLPDDFRSEFEFEFTSLRRSVYLPVLRNKLPEVFANFDFANPNFTVGRRSPSTVPTQALFLSNSPFMHRHAAAAAEQLLALEATDDSERLRLAFLRVLGRPPSAEESSLSLDFVYQGGADPAAWAALHRALFSSLDFRYLP